LIEAFFGLALRREAIARFFESLPILWLRALYRNYCFSFPLPSLQSRSFAAFSGCHPDAECDLSDELFRERQMGGFILS
jgi:hypothetical protein|tara:strand:- start:892 stop:1128 length:237 start_codon:yes stop_codon:yes gene_type:complete